MDQVIDLISSGLDSLEEAETAMFVGPVLVEVPVRYLYQAKSSFMEAQEILPSIYFIKSWKRIEDVAR